MAKRISNWQIMSALTKMQNSIDELNKRVSTLETAQEPKKAKGKKESSEADRTYTKRTPDQLKRWHAEYDARWAKWTKDGTVKHDHSANSRRNREICKELKELGF